MLLQVPPKTHLAWNYGQLSTPNHWHNVKESNIGSAGSEMGCQPALQEEMPRAVYREQKLVQLVPELMGILSVGVHCQLVNFLCLPETVSYTGMHACTHACITSGIITGSCEQQFGTPRDPTIPQGRTDRNFSQSKGKHIRIKKSKPPKTLRSRSTPRAGIRSRSPALTECNLHHVQDV
jgi:hypothetical protein